MYEVLIRLIVGVALVSLGINLAKTNLTSHEGQAKLVQAMKESTKIDWKPISVFPEEAARFRKHAN
jgi:hypothetical protein